MMESLKELIEKTLKELSDFDSPFFSSLYEGSKYALLASGKRLRPLLTLIATEMIIEGSKERALYPACAIEMIHTYSLIHDDLPAMDNDDFRRGKPTVHRIYTEGHAVLIGDYLLTKAFEVLSKAPLLSDAQKIELVRILASGAGGDGMIGGQVMDIEQSPHVEETHLKKTAALFSTSLEFAAVIAEAPSCIASLLKTFGTQFGLLYQIVDDLLDEDCLLNKEAALQIMNTRYSQSVETLNKLPYQTESLMQMTHWVISQIHNTVSR